MNLIVPYKANLDKNDTVNEDFDLMKLLADVQNDNNDDLVLAAMQVEKQMLTSTITTITRSLIKKMSPPCPTPINTPTFSNCSFGPGTTFSTTISKN